MLKRKYKTPDLQPVKKQIFDAPEDQALYVIHTEVYFRGGTHAGNYYQVVMGIEKQLINYGIRQIINVQQKILEAKSIAKV